MTTSENPILTSLTRGEPSSSGAETSKSLLLVDRLGIAWYTTLLTIVATLASALICSVAYLIVGFDALSEPISIILPLLCPMAIVPAVTVRATLSALKLRTQQQRIAEQNQALERIVAEKDRIISLVGHELRGQFNLVMGFAQLISRQAGSIPAELLVDYANEIHLASTKTNDVLNDLLNWGRARAGHLAQSHETIPFNDVLSRVLDTLRLDAERKHVTIQPAMPMPDDEVDHVIVASALRNVLSNAIKYSHSGGRVDISARRDDVELIFTVTDTGVGINLEPLSKLRGGGLVSATEGTSREIGSGLGLAICRDIIEAQGGRLVIESAPGQGTTVTVCIPLGPKIPTRQPDAPDRTGHGMPDGTGHGVKESSG